MSVTKYVIPSTGDRYGLLAIYDILADNGIASDITSTSNSKKLICKLACFEDDRYLQVYENDTILTNTSIKSPSIYIQSDSSTIAQRIKNVNVDNFSSEQNIQRFLYLDTSLNFFIIVWKATNVTTTNTLFYCGKTSTGDWVMFSNGKNIKANNDYYSSYNYGTFFATDTDYRTYRLLCDQNEITSNGEYAQRDIMLASFDTNEILTNSTGQPVTLQGLKNLCVHASDGLTEGENYDYFHMNDLLPTNNSADYFYTAFKLEHGTSQQQYIYVTQIGDIALNISNSLNERIRNLKIFGIGETSQTLKITACGKNLFNINNVVSNNSNVVITDEIVLNKNLATTWTFENAIALKPMTEYTVSCNIEGEFTGRIFRLLSFTVYANMVENNKFVTTNTTNANGIINDVQNETSNRFIFVPTYLGQVSDNLTISNIQVTQSEIELSYAQYNGQTVTVNLSAPLRGVQNTVNYNYTDESGQTWLSDVLDAETGTITRYLDSDSNILDTPTTENVDATDLKTLNSYSDITNLFVDSINGTQKVGISAEFKKEIV